jgi:hypothetical protein
MARATITVVGGLLILVLGAIVLPFWLLPYLLLFVCIGSYVMMLGDDAKLIKRVAATFKPAGIIVWSVLSGATVLSAYSRAIHAVVQQIVAKWCASRNDVRNVISMRIDELWVVLWLFVNLACLYYSSKAPQLVLLSWIRLADLVWVLIFVTVVQKSYQNRERALYNLLIHYFEVIVIFANTYMWLQSSVGDMIFKVDGTCRKLSPSQALYFSFVTGSTIGYGDIVPRDKSITVPFILRPGSFVMAELAVLLFILVISFPRYFADGGAKEGGTGSRPSACTSA